MTSSTALAVRFALFSQASLSGLRARTSCIYQQAADNAMTFWEQNQTYIVGAVAVFLIQSGLIAGLLVQRSRRRRAEGALRVNEHALQVSQEDTRKLAGRLIAAQEVERARIARELHDDLSQKVALLAMDIHQLALSEVPGVRGRAKIMAERTAELRDGSPQSLLRASSSQAPDSGARRRRRSCFAGTSPRAII